MGFIWSSLGLWGCVVVSRDIKGSFVLVRKVLVKIVVLVAHLSGRVSLSDDG